LPGRWYGPTRGWVIRRRCSCRGSAKAQSVIPDCKSVSTTRRCRKQQKVRTPPVAPSARHLATHRALSTKAAATEPNRRARHYRFMSPTTAPPSDPSSAATSPDVLKATARAAKLRSVSDRSPGIRSSRQGEGIDHFGADGAKITNAEELTRINKLAIPPPLRGRLDLPLSKRPSSGRRSRCTGPQAVSLASALARSVGRGQVP
jgi:hypothetical protein